MIDWSEKLGKRWAETRVVHGEIIEVWHNAPRAE
jgi:hypothetical protein